MSGHVDQREQTRPLRTVPAENKHSKIAEIWRDLVRAGILLPQSNQPDPPLNDGIRSFCLHIIDLVHRSSPDETAIVRPESVRAGRQFCNIHIGFYYFVFAPHLSVFMGFVERLEENAIPSRNPTVPR